MAERETDFAALVDRFGRMGRRDRKAVLARFSTEEKLDFEAALEADEKVRAEEDVRQQQADRQFLGYSSWLARIVEQTLADPGSVALSEAAVNVVIAEHKAMIEQLGAEPRRGWRGLLDRLTDFAAPPQGATR